MAIALEYKHTDISPFSNLLSYLFWPGICKCTCIFFRGCDVYVLLAWSLYFLWFTLLTGFQWART